MAKIKIRSYASGDEELVTRIHNSGFGEWIDALGMYYGYVHLKPEDVREWKSRGGLFLAEMEEQPVGYAHFGVWNIAGVRVGGIITHEGDGEYGQGKITVIPGKRRMGVGSELVKTLLNYVKNRGGVLAHVWVYSDNIPAKKLLSKFGFLHYKDRFHHPIISKQYPLHFADIRCAVLDLTQPIPQVKMNQQVKVREVGKEDIEKFSDYAIETPVRTFQDTSKDYLLEWIDGQEIVMVAELEDRIVGCIDADKTTGHMGVSGVLPEFRCRGIGSTLLYRMLNVLKSRGYAKAMTDTEVVNEPAWRLYRKLGFKEDRRIEAWVKLI